MQLPGDFLATLTSKELEAVLISRLKLFIEQHFENKNDFTQNSFFAVFHTLVIEPRHKRTMQEIFGQLLKDGIIENVPENPIWFRFRTRPAIEKSKPAALEARPFITEIRPAP